MGVFLSLAMPSTFPFTVRLPFFLLGAPLPFVPADSKISFSGGILMLPIINGVFPVGSYFFLLPILLSSFFPSPLIESKDGFSLFLF